MKKILFSFMSLLFFGFAANAQNATLSGTVVDASQNPVPGVAVLMYGSVSNHISGGSIQVDPESVYRFAYTDQNGNYNIPWWVGAADTIIVGALDCQHNLVWGSASVSQGSPNGTVNLQIGCVPTLCDAFIWETAYPSNWSEFSAVPLRDSTLSGNLANLWTIGSVTRVGGNPYQMRNGYPDTIIAPTATTPVCYQFTSGCTAVCMGATPPTPTFSCNADFFVDSVNSINFQGQIVVWENSTVDTGATIVGYRWDFGDGSPIVNQQYPSHTYADTGVYEVCLTIISVMQTATTIDTCVSTHCDSIGFDSQGNLIYKSSGAPGFTINVVDPSTVGQSEVDLASHYKLFPNPTSDKATLSWDSEMQVERIDIFSVSGQVVKSIEPSSTSVSLNDMKTGVYIIRVSGDQGDTTLRMIVQ